MDGEKTYISINLKITSYTTLQNNEKKAVLTTRDSPYTCYPELKKTGRITTASEDIWLHDQE